MNQECQNQCHKLWDTISSLGATNTDAALNQLLHGLALLVGAQNGYWMGSMRLSEPPEDDPAMGWRPRVIRQLHTSSLRETIKKEHIHRIKSGIVDQSTIRNLKDFGKFRVTIQHELVPNRWPESEFYQALYKPLGIIDTIYVATPLGERVESWLAFERIGERQATFSEHERELLAYTNRPLKWFHNQLILHHGIMLEREPLKPA